ncbi:MAG: cobyric acid synthase [Devosiaceae bacterium]|nr:cobyric acid synthase [Devosiaceae bacterium MH13]
MVQGTGSNVGKSVIVAGLCRAFARRGLTVLPFKPQNMSNNAAATVDGGEIGRAQALQAQAAGFEPSVHMNPVLLKPQTDIGSQVVVQGKVLDTLDARAYAARKPELLTPVLDSFSALEAAADLILVEGAGSPAEINLRAGDIANMGFALAAEVPAVLCADIDRGGVIASVVGTHSVLEADDRNAIRGYFINRFRGDTSLFDGGLKEISDRTGWPSFGVVPWFDGARDLPAEDVLGLSSGSGDGVVIAVPRLGRIANFDDLDPLRMEPGVDLRIVEPGTPLPADADAVILPGSKATIADLEAFTAEGWATDLHAHVRRGGWVVGLCGGFQMLGKSVADPDGVEGPPSSVAGLGLLDVETVLAGRKKTRRATGVHRQSGISVSGYEIHMGVTTGGDWNRSMVWTDTGADGMVSADGTIMGTYMHGLFGSDAFRAWFLEQLGGRSAVAYEARVEAALDGLAEHLEQHMDLDALHAIAKAR